MEDRLAAAVTKGLKFDRQTTQLRFGFRERSCKRCGETAVTRSQHG